MGPGDPTHETHRQPSVLNLTTELTLPPNVPVDPRISQKIFYTSAVPLDQKSIIGTATATMATLVNMDFWGWSGNFQSPPFPGFPSVSIQFRVTLSSRRIATRIIIWALYDVIHTMAKYRQYGQTKTEISWDGIHVATFSIEPRTSSSQLTLEQRSDSLSRNISDNLPYLPSPANISAASWNNDDLGNSSTTTETSSYGALNTICRYLDGGVELSVAEVLAGFLAVLADVALPSKDDRMDDAFYSNPSGIDSRITFAGPPSDPRHPTYQY